MTYLVLAQLGAQLASVFVYGLIAKWYVAPWLNRLGRADAVMALLWVHVFRYISLFTFSAQHDGYAVSDGLLLDTVVGDIAGATLALAAIGLLRSRARLGLLLSWLLTVETIVGVIVNIYGKAVELLAGTTGGVMWLILAFFVPLVMVSLPLLVWQLYGRRSEPLIGAKAGLDSRPERRAVRLLLAVGEPANDDTLKV
jgi:hypothetical protein